MDATSGAGGDSAITCVGSWDNSGAFTCGASTVALDGATTPVNLTPGSSNLYNLTINKDTATDTVNAITNALNITGALDIQDGTLNLSTTTTITGSATIGDNAGEASTLKSTTASLAANFNDDVMIDADGAFDFQGASMALKFDNEATDLVTVTAGGSFIVKGTDGNLATLSNDSGTDKWHITNGNAQDQSANLTYLTVSYSDASVGTTIQPATTAADGDGNINWLFADGDQISGTVYMADGTTLIDENCNIVMYLYYSGTGSTVTQTDAVTGGVGTFGFTGLNLSAGDIATLYIHDQGSGYEGCATYRSDADGAADVNVYKDHVIIHSDSGSMTNADMTNADDGDPNIRYEVVGGVLTVDDSFEAYIFGGTFQPGAAVIVDDINVNNGAFTMEANAVTVSGTWITGADGAFTSSGTVTFDSAAAEQITSHGESFGGVIFDGHTDTGSWSLQDATDINGTITIISGTLIDNGQTIICSGNFANSDKFTATGAIDFDMSSGAFVTLDSGGTAASQDFNNFEISGGNNGRVTLSVNPIKVNGTFTVAASNEFNTSATDACVVEIAGTVDINGTYAAANNGATTITGAGTGWDSSGGVYDIGAGKTPTLIFNTTGTSNFINIDDETYYNLTHQGAGDIVLDTATDQAGISVDGVFTKAALSGDFGDGAGDHHNIYLINGGAVTAPFVFTGGTLSLNRFIFKGSTANTVIPVGTYGTGDVTIEPSADTTFVLGGHVILAQAGGSCELKVFGGLNNVRATLNTTAANSYSITCDALGLGYSTGGGVGEDYWGTLKCNNSSIAVSGNLTYNTAGSAIDADTSDITIGDDFNNTAAGAFTYDTGEVIFDNNANTTAISGDNTFYDFTCVTADKALQFANGSTQTISTGGTLNLTGGAAGDEVTLDSVTAGTYWNIDCEDTQTVEFVNVIDSDASVGGGKEITADHSINRGHNDNWDFGNITRYWVAIANGDWNTNANWSSASGAAPGADYPDAGDAAIFDNGSDKNCTLDAAVSIATLDMRGGATAYTGIISCGTNNFTTSGDMDITSGIFTVGANTTRVDGTLTVDGGTGTFTSGALDCNGAVDISAGVLTAPSGNFNVATNWSHSGGTFNHSDGTVIFDTAAASTIADNTTFYNLNCTQAGKQINFTNGTTQTVNNTLTLNGQATGTKIDLNSTTPGSKWDITFPNGAQTVSFIDVKDSDANTNTVTCYNSTDSGDNNANWIFNTLSIVTPQAGKTTGQQATIRGQAGAGDTITIKGTVGTLAYQTVATVTADANGSYIVRQTDYTGTLDAGANNIRADVGVTLGTPVNLTVSATPTTNEVPVISSPVDGGKVSGVTPALSGSGLAGQNVILSAWDANGNLLLTDVATAVTGADGIWNIAESSYTTSLVKGTNYLTVTISGVASDVISVTFTDPFGIVFDSVTNNPIANASVTIYNADGTLCVNGVDIAAGDFNPQTTAADGAYNFLCANGNYYITVNAAGYNYPSVRASFPTGRTIVAGSKGEVFTVAGVIIEMDHPMDSNHLLLKVKKEANKKEVVIGDVVTYTVTIKNVSAGDVTNVFLEDRIPPGFKYLSGKAILDNIPTQPTGANALLFDLGAIPAQETRTLKYQLVVGSGVTTGNYENTAWCRYANETIISNKDHAEVKVVLDPLFDLGTVIGKVFLDSNENTIQDEGEKTIPYVSLVTEDGTTVTTDANGLYHIPGLMPGRHLIRLDESTLTEGASLTTDKVAIIDITKGLLSKVNFGVKMPSYEDIKQLPIRIIQERSLPQPRLNIALYPEVVIMPKDNLTIDTDIDRYEFKMFTNYHLFIDSWQIELLDKETKKQIKLIEGKADDINKPILWDVTDNHGKPLDINKSYTYRLSVKDKTGRKDTTIEKDLILITEEPEESFLSENTSLKEYQDFLKTQNHINILDKRSIPIKGETVLIKSQVLFENTPSPIEANLDIDKSKEETLTLIIDGKELPLLSDKEDTDNFTKDLILPEGNHKLTVKSFDEEGGLKILTKDITSKENSLFFVALGDTKVGYNFQKGYLEPVSASDRFKEGFWSEGKLAYYLKGKVLGKYMITSSLDTKRGQKELFKNLDPDKYYPVYGDTSTIDYKATDTQGVLYLLIEWDKSSILWGNYQTGFTDTDLAGFNRTLYGGKLEYETVSSTRFGEPVTKLILFKARAQAKAAHVEFTGTGGSLFYFKHKDVVEGSEKVAIEVRDKTTGLVLSTLSQAEGFDYEIDYDNGRLIFWEPVSYVIESDSIISSHILDGNPVYVTIDYEYETLDKYDRGIYGARAKQSLTDYLEVGGTYVKEEQVGANYELKGADTTIHLGDKTQIKAEYAESESDGANSFISTDGGLNFTELATGDTASARAYSVKGESHLIDNLKVEGSYTRIEDDFSTSQTTSHQGKETITGRATYDLTDNTRLRVEHNIQELLGGGNTQTQLQVGAEKATTSRIQIAHTKEKVKLMAEYRHQEIEDKLEAFNSETNTEDDILAAGIEYKLNEKVILSLEQEATLKGEANHKTTAGIKTRPNDNLTLGLSETVGTQSTATNLSCGYNLADDFEVIGTLTNSNYIDSTENKAAVTTRAQIDDKNEIYHTYSLTDSSIDRRSYASVLGLKSRLTPQLEFTLEEENASSGYENSNTDIFGLKGKVNDNLTARINFEKGAVQNHDGAEYDRYAGSLGLSYIDGKRLSLSSKLELRLDEGQEDKRQYLIYNALEGKLKDHTTIFAKANLSQTENTTLDTTEGLYKELVLGCAHRPVLIDRLNFLTKYTYLEDDSPISQDGYEDIEEEKAHVLSGEAAYDLTKRWQLVEKFALRLAEEKVTGFDFTGTQTWLALTRLNCNINKNWQLAGEYRYLSQKEAEDYKHGALLEVSRNIGDFIQVGVGYNFTDFNDDLTHLDYTSHGPFIRFTGKLWK